jgi:hypothetical protein
VIELGTDLLPTGGETGAAGAPNERQSSRVRRSRVERALDPHLDLPQVSVSLPGLTPVERTHGRCHVPSGPQAIHEGGADESHAEDRDRMSG